MIPTSAPPRVATPPHEKAPAGAVDTHIHVLAGPQEFALSAKRAENPAKNIDMDRFIALYRAQMETLGIERTVVVHSILYGSDNAVTCEAISRLGHKTTRGIGLLSDDANIAELDTLQAAGICGIRLNYVHGGVLSWDGVKFFAPALAERGMHVQMLVNTHKHLVDLKTEISKLPVPVVFDHLGWPDLERGPNDPGFQALCALMADGHVYTKLSGLYRLAQASFDATDSFVKAAITANPERCLWGSDYPYIMLANAKMPDAGELMNAFNRVVKDAEMRRRILVETPEKLYGF